MTPSTGDPTLDGLLQWITAGGSLTSPGAIFALALIVNAVAMPLLSKLAAWRKLTFTGTTATWGAFLSSLALVMGVGWYTHTLKSFNEAVPFSIQVALAAMGLHAARKTASASSLADKTDDELTAAAMPPIPPGQPE